MKLELRICHLSRNIKTVNRNCILCPIYQIPNPMLNTSVNMFIFFMLLLSFIKTYFLPSLFLASGFLEQAYPFEGQQLSRSQPVSKPGMQPKIKELDTTGVTEVPILGQPNSPYPVRHSCICSQKRKGLRLVKANSPCCLLLTVAISGTFPTHAHIKTRLVVVVNDQPSLHKPPSLNGSLCLRQLTFL